MDISITVPFVIFSINRKRLISKSRNVYRRRKDVECASYLVNLDFCHQSVFYRFLQVFRLELTVLVDVESIGARYSEQETQLVPWCKGKNVCPKGERKANKIDAECFTPQNLKYEYFSYIVFIELQSN